MSRAHRDDGEFCRVRLGRPRDRCFQQGSYSAIVLYREENHSIDRTERPGTGESADTDRLPATQMGERERWSECTRAREQRNSDGG